MWFMLVLDFFCSHGHSHVAMLGLYHINDIKTSKQAAAASAIMCYTGNILKVV